MGCRHAWVVRRHPLRNRRSRNEHAETRVAVETAKRGFYMGRERAGFTTCYSWLLHSTHLIVGVAL